MNAGRDEPNRRSTIGDVKFANNIDQHLRYIDNNGGMCYYRFDARAVWSTHIISSCLLRKEVVP